VRRYGTAIGQVGYCGELRCLLFAWGTAIAFEDHQTIISAAEFMHGFVLAFLSFSFFHFTEAALFCKVRVIY